MKNGRLVSERIQARNKTDSHGKGTNLRRRSERSTWLLHVDGILEERSSEARLAQIERRGKRDQAGKRGNGASRKWLLRGGEKKGGMEICAGL